MMHHECTRVNVCVSDRGNKTISTEPPHPPGRSGRYDGQTQGTYTEGALAEIKTMGPRFQKAILCSVSETVEFNSARYLGGLSREKKEKKKMGSLDFV